MQNLTPLSAQERALWDELDAATRWIRAGLREVQQINGANDFSDLPILLPATGFERLMKIILCLHVHETTGEYPKPGQCWPKGKKGHDLEYLLDRIIDGCFSEYYLQHVPAASTDRDYLRSEPLREVVRPLSKFGQGARYHHLDIVLGKAPRTPAPRCLGATGVVCRPREPRFCERSVSLQR